MAWLGSSGIMATLAFTGNFFGFEMDNCTRNISSKDGGRGQVGSKTSSRSKLESITLEVDPNINIILQSRLLRY